MATRTVNEQEDLIARYIEENPDKPGIANARLIEEGVPVWALIGYLPAVDGSAEQVAADYDIPLEAVEAALAYYEAHRSLIDARIEANRIPGND